MSWRLTQKGLRLTALIASRTIARRWEIRLQRPDGIGRHGDAELPNCCGTLSDDARQPRRHQTIAKRGHRGLVESDARYGRSCPPPPAMTIAISEAGFRLVSRPRCRRDLAWELCLDAATFGYD